MNLQIYEPEILLSLVVTHCINCLIFGFMSLLRQRRHARLDSNSQWIGSGNRTEHLRTHPKYSFTWRLFYVFKEETIEEEKQHYSNGDYRKMQILDGMSVGTVRLFI